MLTYCVYSKQRNGTSCTSGNALATDRQFTGQKYDVTGLHYYNARYFDDHIGQFVSPDSVVPDPGSVLSYNRFMYGLGNPLRFSDPSGHVACEGAGSDCSTRNLRLYADFKATILGDDTDYSANAFYQDLQSATQNAGGYSPQSLDLVASGMAQSMIKHGYAEDGIMPVQDAVYFFLITRDPNFGLAVAQEHDAQVAQQIFSSAMFFGSTVTLYRAIGASELEDVNRLGDYGIAPSGGGKYFAFTEDGARNFANHPFNAEQDLTITQIQVPKTFVKQNGYRFYDPGGAGDSVHFADDVLPALYESMRNLKILPK
ncbi:MAG: RHS repeat-associated core domain-containing protein [Caldilineaceae bacterium]|nr:RHS repeat-associated core domain-containing protein [Caldilineaceae bacterium]